MTAKSVTQVSCQRCGWVRVVTFSDAEGPIRQLQRHVLEEHRAPMEALSAKSGNVNVGQWREDIGPEPSLQTLVSTGGVVTLAELAARATP